MKTFFKTSLILLVTLTGIIACGDDSEENIPETKAVLHLDKESLAFGEIAQENPKDLEFVIANKGDGILKITSVEIEGVNKDQFATTLAVQDINAGKSTTFTVTFQPSTGGDKVAELKFVTNVGTKIISLSGSSQYLDDNIVELDAEFKRYLIVTNIDSNIDGKIQYSEVKNETYLYVRSSFAVESLKGIEAFSSLEEFKLVGNSKITTIDFSKNINLERLTLLAMSELETINVSGCIYLSNLLVNESPLKTIDLSTNTGLAVLNLGLTQIAALDLSNNILLENVFYNGSYDMPNGALTSLNLKNLTNLDPDKVEFSGHKNLECVSVDAGVDITTNGWSFGSSGELTTAGKVVVCD